MGRLLFLCLELSSEVQRLIEKDFKRRSPAETLAGTKIDLVGKGDEESRIERVQVSRLGAILADESIGVFISTTHPGGSAAVERKKERH